MERCRAYVYKISRSSYIVDVHCRSFAIELPLGDPPPGEETEEWKRLAKYTERLLENCEIVRVF